jgi:predicted nucleotidyltransferase
MSDIVNTHLNAAKFAWTDHLADLAQRAAFILAEKMNADAVWLFGSVARKDWNADSDIDLLVVVADSEQPRHRRAQRAHFLMDEIHAPKDVIVLTRKEWESGQLAPASLVSTVKREGVCLHERGK